MIDGSWIEVDPDDVELINVSKRGYSVVEESDMLVGVHKIITKDLESEGLARDLVRRIQALRKEADFEIDDHIKTYFQGSHEVESVFQDESHYIKIETLSKELIKAEAPKNATVQVYNIDGLRVKIGVVKV
jgi:isoleucyl-tRNA synthetase